MNRALTSCLQRERRDRDSRGDVLERGDDAIAEVQRDLGAVDQSADHAQVGLLVELDVDQHVRHVVGEAGEERLANDGPRTDRSATADRHEGELGVTVVTVLAHDVGWDGERAAPGAPRHREHVRSRGFPERRRLLVGHRHRAGRRRHGITPSSRSAPICSHV